MTFQSFYLPVFILKRGGADDPIITLFSSDKEKKMSIRHGKDKTVQFVVPHGMAMMFSKRGGGVTDKDYKHKVIDAEKTMNFCLEVCKK